MKRKGNETKGKDRKGREGREGRKEADQPLPVAAWLISCPGSCVLRPIPCIVN